MHITAHGPLWPAYLMRHGPFLARLVFSNEKACIFIGNMNENFLHSSGITCSCIQPVWAYSEKAAAYTGVKCHLNVTKRTPFPELCMLYTMFPLISICRARIRLPREQQFCYLY